MPNPKPMLFRDCTLTLAKLKIIVHISDPPQIDQAVHRFSITLDTPGTQSSQDALNKSYRQLASL
jgi:hypothetical protein